MDAGELRQRTKKFGLNIIKLVDSLPSTQTGRVIGNQLLLSALSVGANYRAACRARSKADFISKVGISIEETDESQHWLEMLGEAGLLPLDKLKPLVKEADELTAILTASAKTARENLKPNSQGYQGKGSTHNHQSLSSIKQRG
jgi:four helix bundle protein